MDNKLKVVTIFNDRAIRSQCSKCGTTDLNDALTRELVRLVQPIVCYKCKYGVDK